MAGLSLGGGAQVRVSAQPTYGSISNPASSSVAGFGPGGAPPQDQGLAALKPNDPAGVTFLIGVLSVGLLVLVYWSLPR